MAPEGRVDKALYFNWSKDDVFALWLSHFNIYKSISRFPYKRVAAGAHAHHTQTQLTGLKEEQRPLFDNPNILENYLP